jgi:hypothetical protein
MENPLPTNMPIFMLAQIDVLIYIYVCGNIYVVLDAAQALRRLQEGPGKSPAQPSTSTLCQTSGCCLLCVELTGRLPVALLSLVTLLLLSAA